MTTAMDNFNAGPAEVSDPYVRPAVRIQNPCLVHSVPLLLACLAAAEMEADAAVKPMADVGRKCAEQAGASPRPGTRFGGTGPVQTPAASVVAEPEFMPGQSAAETAVQQTPLSSGAAYEFAPPSDDPGTAALETVPGEEDWPEGDGLDAVLAEAAQAAAELSKERYGVPYGDRHARRI